MTLLIGPQLHKRVLSFIKHSHTVTMIVNNWNVGVQSNMFGEDLTARRLPHPDSFQEHSKHRVENNQYLLLQYSKEQCVCQFVFFPLRYSRHCFCSDAALLCNCYFMQQLLLLFCSDEALLCHSCLKQQPPPLPFFLMQLYCITVIQ